MLANSLNLKNVDSIFAIPAERRYRPEDRMGTDFKSFREFRSRSHAAEAGSRTLVTKFFSSLVHRFFAPKRTRSRYARDRDVRWHASFFDALRCCAWSRIGRGDEPLCRHARSPAPPDSPGVRLRMQPFARSSGLYKDMRNGQARTPLEHFKLRKAADENADREPRGRPALCALRPRRTREPLTAQTQFAVFKATV